MFLASRLSDPGIFGVVGPPKDGNVSPFILCEAGNEGTNYPNLPKKFQKLGCQSWWESYELHLVYHSNFHVGVQRQW